MTPVPDLLAGEPTALRPTPAARLRRGLAAALTAVAVLAGALPVLAVSRASSVAPSVGDAPDELVPAPVAPAPAAAATPSATVARALAAPWALLDLTLRPEGHGTAAVTARFAAPAGRPARPDELIAILDHPSLTSLEPVALIATADGTAVDVAARLRIDTARRPGDPVPAAALAGRIAEAAVGGGASIRGIRTAALETGGTAAVVSLDAGPDATVAVLAALEEGVSAPARMTTLLLRRTGEGFALDVTLTPRAAPDGP